MISFNNLSPVYKGTVAGRYSGAIEYPFIASCGGEFGSYYVMVTYGAIQTPRITVNISGCPSQNLTLTALPVNGGANPSIKWYRNRDTSAIGSNTPLVTSILTNGDKITTRMTVGTSICTNMKLVSSDTVIISCINTATKNINDLFKIYIFPNPTTGVITVEVTTSEATAINYQITNILGQIIGDEFTAASHKEVTRQSFDISHLVKGIYFIRVRIGNQESIHKIQLY